MLLPIIALKGKSRRQTTDTRVWFENPLNLGYFKRKKKEWEKRMERKVFQG